jgi:hypothetical protein
VSLKELPKGKVSVQLLDWRWAPWWEQMSVMPMELLWAIALVHWMGSVWVFLWESV